MKVVFGGKLLIGSLVSEIKTPSTFIATDFPLPRKETSWNDFPPQIFYNVKRTLPYQTKYLTPSLPKPLTRTDTPNFPAWNSAVQTVIHSENTKVVLARKTTFTFDQAIDPYLIIDLLAQKNANAQVFGIILDEHRAFVGATPELLIKRRDQSLQTEALAGTKKLREEAQLLQSEKDLKEFQIVKEDLQEKLTKIAKPFDVHNKIIIKKTATLCHLHHPFDVTLKQPMSDQTLIDLLHPTPAIAGFPREGALRAISSCEPFDRGLYGGVVGMISSDSSELYVAIRSALIDHNKVHLFAGAGIVQGSSGDLEWEELENKIAQFGVS